MSVLRTDYILSSLHFLPTDLIFCHHVIQRKRITCPISDIMGNYTTPRIWGKECSSWTNQQVKDDIRYHSYETMCVSLRHGNQT